MANNLFNIGTFKAPKLHTLKVVKSGDRTLKSSDKRRLKTEKGNRCHRCHKIFPPNLLEVHHIRAVHKFKKKFELGTLATEVKKQSHDRKSNLMVLCPLCHKKVHDAESMKNKERKKRQKKREQASGPFGFKSPF